MLLVVGGHGALLFALRCFFAWSPTILFVTTQQFHQIATMMKLAITALLAGSAAAFAPAQSGRVATDLAVSELEVRLFFSPNVSVRLAACFFPLRLSRQHACMIRKVPMVPIQASLYCIVLLNSERIVSRYSKHKLSITQHFSSLFSSSCFRNCFLSTELKCFPPIDLAWCH